MNKNLFLLFILMPLLLPKTVSALAFSDVADQTAIGPLLKEAPKYSYTPAFGLSTHTNSATINQTTDLSSTNRNAYVLGLDINGSNSLLSWPQKDQEDYLRERVNSKSFFAQTNFNVYKNFKAEVTYVSTQGYYIEENVGKNSSTYLFPDLSFEKIGTGVNWLSNEKHSSFIFSPILFKPSESSSSWIVGMDLDRYKISGLNDLQKVQALKSGSLTDAAMIYNLSFSVNYSKTKFFRHWFWGGAIGVILNNSFIEKRYVTNAISSETSQSTSSLVSLSGGYTWKQLTVGFFANAKNVVAEIDTYKINNSVGKTGIYSSYQF